MGNYLLQTFFFLTSSSYKQFFPFFSVFFLFVLNITIALLNNDVQGAEGTQDKKRQKPLSSFVKKDLIDEPQVSTNYIIEKDIHATCGYESVKCYPSPNV